MSVNWGTASGLWGSEVCIICRAPVLSMLPGPQRLGHDEEPSAGRVSPEAPGEASPHLSRVPTTPTMALKNLEAAIPLLVLTPASFLRTPVTTRLLYKQHGSCCMCLWQGVYIPGRLRITASATLQTIRTCGIREHPGDMT